ncbi:xylulokinase [Vagococcus sp. JNUCC 83]
MSYVLGIDLGTGSLKGILIDKLGKIECEATSTYKTYTENNGKSEQNPSDWIQALEKVFEDLLIKCPSMSEELEGISFSGQMHSLVLLDKDNQIIRPSILWNDCRTTKQCKELNTTFVDKLINITENRALEGFTLPKILWLQENEPENWKKVSKILLPKDYLSFYLTGNLYTDFSDASGTLLLDVDKKDWSISILDEFNININQLPKIKKSDDIVGSINLSFIEKYNLKHSVKIITGGADNACAALACGVVDKSDALLSIGTSGVFLTSDTQKDPTGSIHSFYHVLSDKKYSMGVTLSAGKSLSWFQHTFASNKQIKDLIEDIEVIKEGADGLLFSPYIMGERTPYNDGEIKGSFIGIDASHTMAHFTRAVIEGITFSLKEVKDEVEEQTNQHYTRIISTGGGAKSEQWLQIQANILNATIITIDNEQGPGVGAAMLAAKGLKWFKTDEELLSVFVNYKKKYYPESEVIKSYQLIYQLYKQIYPSTRKLCHELMTINKEEERKND